jgi:hypothetical protein
MFDKMELEVLKLRERFHCMLVAHQVFSTLKIFSLHAYVAVNGFSFTVRLLTNQIKNRTDLILIFDKYCISALRLDRGPAEDQWRCFPPCCQPQNQVKARTVLERKPVD